MSGRSKRAHQRLLYGGPRHAIEAKRKVLLDSHPELGLPGDETIDLVHITQHFSAGYVDRGHTMHAPEQEYRDGFGP